MFAFDQSDTAVRIHFQTAGGRFSETGDFAIITAPFPVLRHVEAIKPLSPGMQRAIRQLRYDASAKILMQFRRRFWEDDDGIVGGGSVTDLPIRAVYYPDHHRETGRGVLLASYTWNEDAQRWGSLSPADRVTQALENLAQIHPQAPAEFEVGTSYMWHHDEFAGGAFALFDPGQQTRLHDTIVRPEGRIYFAGEHTSLAHAWIQGAVESGLRDRRLQIHRAAVGAASMSPCDSSCHVRPPRVCFARSGCRAGRVRRARAPEPAAAGSARDFRDRGPVSDVPRARAVRGRLRAPGARALPARDDRGMELRRRASCSSPAASTRWS